MKIKYKTCECVFTGWRWKMPVIPKNVYLGTWDLADWTFGPPTYITLWGGIFGDKWPKRWPRLITAIWRIENWLRCIMWTMYFKRHYTMFRALDCIRDIAFRISNGISRIWYMYGKW